MQVNPYKNFAFFDQLVDETQYHASPSTHMQPGDLFSLVPDDPALDRTRYNHFCAYTTPEGGWMPVVHMYKDRLAQFIDCLETNTDDRFYFISDPLQGGFRKRQTCCSFWESRGGKIHYTEYEDGHSAYDTCYADITNTLIDRIRAIYEMIPDNVDLVLDRI